MLQTGACYIRVSTEDQTEYSPDAQLRMLKDYANKNNIIIPDEHVYIDAGISGRNANKRPAFMKMIAASKVRPKPFELILVHKFDRFARSREDSVVYKSLLKKEAGIKVISITESIEDDKFSVILEAMLEAMAEYYSLNLADEVKKGMFEKARKGENIGKAPYGYTLERKVLKINPEESEIVKYIFDTYIDTGSLSYIARYLNANKVPSKNNGNWSVSTVKYMLENPVYTGTTRYNYRKKGHKKYQNEPSEWIIAKGAHVPIVENALFEKVQRKLQALNGVYPRTYSDKNIRHWAQHIVKCELCGRVLTINMCGGGKYKTYRCGASGIGLCQGKALSVKKLDEIVFEILYRDFATAQPFAAERVMKTTYGSELKSLNDRLKKIKSKYDLIKKAYIAQVDTLEEYKNNKEMLKKEEGEILLAIESIEISARNTVKNAEPIKYENFVSLLENGMFSVEDKNKAAKRFIKEIRLDLSKKTVRIIYFYESCIRKNNGLVEQTP